MEGEGAVNKIYRHAAMYRKQIPQERFLAGISGIRLT